LFFAFVGDGPVRPELESTAKVLGCEDRLHITGMVPIPDVPHWLSALDIAVIPRAAPHASPMKLMEYMAMGLPIIAPELPSIRAAMPTDNLGFVFPADDMNAMRNAVEMALANPAEAKRRGEAAREYVLKHLTWTAHAREVLTRLGYDLSSQTELVVAPKVGLGPQGEQPQDLSGKLGAGSAGSAVNPSQSQQAAQ